MTTFLEAAMQYAARGWSVIPIRHGAKPKMPALRAWKPYAVNAASPAQLKAWFTGRHLDGLAVITGEVSGGLTIRDFDDAEAYRRWSVAHPDLAATLPTVQTARGYHVWFRSDTRKSVLLQDGELRAGGLYVIAPPSRHPSGGEYRWLIPLPPVGEPLQFIDAAASGLARCWSDSTALPASQVSQQSNRETERTEPFKPHACVMASVSSVSSVRSVGSVLSVGASEATAIESTQPKRAGERNGCIFDLARTLKAMPQYGGAEPTALRPILLAWHQKALAVIGTKPFDATWSDFLHAWARVIFPKGSEPMAAIANRASSSEPPAWALERFDCPHTHRLLLLCRELHRATGGGVWFLACRTAGRLLDIDHATAWSRLRLLEAEGVLQVAERGSVGGKRATRYRYIAEDGGA